MVLERNQNRNQFLRETLETESESESIVTGIGIGIRIAIIEFGKPWNRTRNQPKWIQN